MATTLAQQLQQLSQAQGQLHSGKRPRGKPSLLFDFQKAADVDLATIHQIGCEGVDELCRLEPRFQRYRESLFGQAAASLNRDLQTPDVVQKLDETINGFLCLLTNHFLSQAAFKVLEYLIRRFKVNECNVDALILCGLPYHATNEFVRLVQVLMLPRNGAWSWLARMQESGAALPREVLVQRCVNDKAVLTFLCEGARRLGRRKLSSQTYLSFYAVCLCEVVASCPQVDEARVAALLPFLVEGLSSSSATDYRAATLMVVAELASRAQLGADFLKSIITSTVQGMEPSPEHIRTVLLILSHLAATQSGLKQLPGKALKGLLAVATLQRELSKMSSSRVRLAPLLKLLASSLVRCLAAGKDAGSSGGVSAATAESVLLDLCRGGLLEAAAQGVTEQLLQLPEQTREGEARGSMQRVLRALELRYPAAVDAAVDAVLRPLQSHKQQQSDPGGSSSEDGDEEREDEDEAARKQSGKAVYDFVRETFASTAHALCGDTAQTVATAVSAPQPSVRRMALEQIDELLAGTDLAAESRAFLQGCALGRLADEDLDVVTAALNMSALRTIAPAALLPPLITLLSRLSSLLLGPGKYVKSGAARAAAKAALKLVCAAASHQWQADPSATSPNTQHCADVAVVALLDYVLPSRNALGLATVAVSLAGPLAEACPAGPLKQLLSAIPQVQPQAEALAKAVKAVKHAEDAASGQQEQAKVSGSRKGKKQQQQEPEVPDKQALKQQRAEAVAALHRAVVDSLGMAVAADSVSMSVEVSRLAAVAQSADFQPQATHLPQRSVHLLLLGLQHALHLLKSGASAAAPAPTPSKQKRGSSQVAAATAVKASPEQVSGTAKSLLSLGLAQLTQLGSTGLKPQDFASWQDSAKLYLDPAGLPLQEHVQDVTSHLSKAHAVLLCKVIMSALEALLTPSTTPKQSSSHAAETAAEPAQALEEPFLQVASLQPATAFRDHLKLLLLSHLPSSEQQLRFLSSLYAAPAGSKDVVPAAQAASLALLPAVLQASASSPTASSSQQPATSMWLPYVLAALQSPAAEVRAQAVQALQQAAVAVPAAPACLFAAAAAVQVHALQISADPGAASLLLRNTFTSDARSASAAAAEPPPSATKKRGSGSAASKQQQAAGPTVARLGMEHAAVQELHTLLSQSLVSLRGCSAADLNAARTVLEVLETAHSAEAAASSGWDHRRLALLPPACQLLEALLATASSSSLVPGGQMALVGKVSSLLVRCALSTDLVPRLPSTTLAVLPKALASGTPGQAAGSGGLLAPLRLALLAALQADGGLLPALEAAAPELRAPIYLAVMQASTSDEDESCRRQARAVLEQANIGSDILSPLLRAVKLGVSSSEPATSTRKPKRGRKEAVADEQQQQQQQLQGGATASTAAADLAMAVTVLELLQWKDVSAGLPDLVAAAHELLEGLTGHLGSIAVVHTEGGEEEEEEDQGEGQQQEGPSSSLAGYAAQLILSALDSILAKQPHSADVASPAKGAGHKGGLLSAFKPELVVKVAQAAPDSAVRNAALSLLSSLAKHLPKAVLGHVLQVLAVIHHSAAIHDDEHSRRVATTAMAAVVPAWLSAGKDAARLWSSVIEALPGLPSHRRLPLLAALLEPLPEEAGLPLALHLLLQASLQDAPEAAPQQQAEGGPVAQSTWLRDLAAQLTQQVEPANRLRAFSGLLQRCSSSSGGQVHAALPSLAVTFITEQHKVRSLASARGAPGSEEELELQSACEELMRQTLVLIQTLTKAQLDPSASPATAAGVSKKAAKQMKTALEGVYALLRGLQAVMASDAYLRALVALAETCVDKTRRVALKLFADKVALLPVELKGGSGLNAKQKAEQQQRIAAAAWLVCAMLRRQHEGSSKQTTPAAATPARKGSKKADAAAAAEAPVEQFLPLSRQALLIAVSSTISVFGGEHVDNVIGVLPAVLAYARDSNTAVRGSALATIAAAARVVGARLVPVLPAAVDALLAAGQGACQALQSAQAAAPTDMAVDGNSTTAAQEAADAAAIELSSALTALDALVTSLGAFLNPYLPSLLSLLLAPEVLSCSTAGCATTAAAVRASLPKAVPARLLLEPLFGQLQQSMERGIESLRGLLELVASMAAGMEAKVAAAYHEQIFPFLLRALDIRQARPDSLTGHIAEAEAHAIKALTALVMKLSESRFKPMFLRLLEWSSTTLPDAEATGGGPLGRQAALFGVAGALTERLRSVFVPYFRYLMDKSVNYLSGSAGLIRPKKKKKTQGPQGADGAAEGPSMEDSWVLRVRVVRALHRALLHDTNGFFDQEKFTRLLAPLVSMLEVEAPEPVAPLMAPQGSDADLQALLPLPRPHSAYDSLGVAVAACLVQMAVTANSDVLWKPLNHQVLMCTRSSSVRTRLLALEVVAQLVTRLREEYLPLLPETIPFLAESLEDSDVAVEARAQDIIKLLEEVSGEKLDQYLKV